MGLSEAVITLYNFTSKVARWIPLCVTLTSAGLATRLLSRGGTFGEVQGRSPWWGLGGEASGKFLGL